MSMPTLEEIVQAIEAQIASEGSALLRRVLAADPNFVRRIAEERLGPTLRAAAGLTGGGAPRTGKGGPARRAMGTHLGGSTYLRAVDTADGLVRLEIQFEDQVFRSREAKTIEEWAPMWSALKAGAKNADTFDHHEVGDKFGVYWLSVDKDGNEYDPYADEPAQPKQWKAKPTKLPPVELFTTATDHYDMDGATRELEKFMLHNRWIRKVSVDNVEAEAQMNRYRRMKHDVWTEDPRNAEPARAAPVPPAGLPATMLVGSSVSNAEALDANTRAFQNADRAARESESAYREALDRLAQVDKHDLLQVNEFLAWWRTHQRVIRVDPWIGRGQGLVSEATKALLERGAAWTMDDTLRLPRAAPASKLPQNDVIKHRADRVIPALRLWFDLSRAEEVVAAQAEGRGRVDAAARTEEERAVRAWTALPEPLRDAAIELDHILALTSPNWSDDAVIARAARIQVAIARIRPTEPGTILPTNVWFMTELRRILDAEDADDVSPRSIATEIRRGSLAWFVDPDVGDEAREDVGGTPTIAPFDPAFHTKLVADSIEQLRRVDVYRLLESAPQEHREAMAAYIRKHRPDLASDVAKMLEAVAEDEGEPAPAAPANAVRVVLNDKGFLLENTDRSHADRIKAINAPGRWMWSRALSAWYLLRVSGERAWSAAPDVVRQLNAVGIPAVLIDGRDGAAAPLSDQDSPPRPATPAPSAPTRAARPPKPPKRKKVDMKALPDAETVPVSSDLVGTWVWTGNASGTFWLSPLEAGKSKGSLTVTGDRTIAESSIVNTRHTRGNRGLYRRGKDYDPDSDGVVRDALMHQGDVIDGTPAGWKLSPDGEWLPYAQQSIVDLSTLKKLQLVGGPVARFLARCWGLQASERILFWGNRRLVDVTRPGVEIEVQDNEPVVVIGSDVELREVPDKPEGPTGTVRVGDHFLQTYIADASLYAFYEVVRVSPSMKTVDLRGVDARLVQDGSAYGRLFPVSGAFNTSSVETVRVQYDADGTPRYAGRMRYVRPGEGHPHYPYGM